MLSKAKLKYVKSLELKKNRQREGMFVAEGPKVVADLIAVYQPRMLFALPSWIEANSTLLHSLKATELIDVTDDELRRLSFLQHPQQVLGVFQVPSSKFQEGSIADKTNLPSPPPGEAGRGLGALALPLLLALDSVQDPGNLGTIIRIADWFGITQIYCSPDTADAWSPKVVQATMGSISRVNITYTDLHALLDSLPSDFPVYGTLLDGEDINDAPLANRGLIIMGNEGKGISPAIASRVTHRLFIPNYPKGRQTADSLNVAIATAITCFAVRQHA